MKNFLKFLADRRTFDIANEGNPGGDADAQAAAAAATAAAEAAAAELAAAEAAAALAAEEDAKGDKKDAKMSATEAALLREVMDKKTKLQTTTAALEQANVALAAFDGVDPEEVRSLLKAKKDAQAADLEAKGEFTRLKAMMAEEHERAMTTLREENAKLLSDMKNVLGDNDKLTVGATFSNSKFISEELLISSAHTRRLYGDRFGMKDGVLVGYDKPEGSADRTVMVDASGNPLAFDEALRRVVDADPESKELKRAKIKPGSSSKTETGVKPAKEGEKSNGLHGAARIVNSFNFDD